MPEAEACCSSAEQPGVSSAPLVCPGCGQCGRQITLTTVQVQVAISLRALTARSYQFCATPGCEVVYYAVGAPPVLRDQMREPVFQKDPAADVLVCYCFRLSRGLLEQGSHAKRTAILAEIVAGTRQGLCACELRNPQGSCCLGNVRGLLRGDEPIVESGTEELA